MPLSAEPSAAFTTAAPAVSAAECEALLADRYGMKARVFVLPSERDLTARVEAANERYVLKIANASEDPASISFQDEALLHLERRAPDVPVPRLVQTRSGDVEFSVEVEGRRHLSRLLTWLPGRPLAGTPLTEMQAAGVGEALGRLARGLSDFDHPASDHDIVWDLKHAPRLLSFTPHIEDPTLRQRVERVLARFRDEIAPLESELRWQVVHNDFNPFNLLVDEEDASRLTGIIDFGDMVRTPAVYDLAVACSYQVAQDGDPLRFASRLVAGYHLAHPVLESELSLLLRLMMTRQAMTIAIAEWRANRYPHNAAYIRRNCGRAVQALSRCETIGDEHARAAFTQAVAAISRP